MIKSITELKSAFERYKKPTAEDFINLIDTMFSFQPVGESWDPTVGDLINVSGYQDVFASYIKSGEVVQFAISGIVEVTADSTTTSVTFTVPVASDINSGGQYCYGHLVVAGVNNAVIQAYNDKIQIQFTSVSDGNTPFTAIGQYIIR